MKSMLTFIRSFFSIGFLGLVFALMTIAILIGAASATLNFSSFETIWRRIDALTALEDKAAVALREMELNELYYAYALDYGTPLTDELEKVTKDAAQVNQVFDDLIDQGHFTPTLGYPEEAMPYVDDFRSQLAQHLQTFDQVVLVYQEAARTGDYETAYQLMDTAQEQNAGLQDMLKQMIFFLDADRMQASQAFPQDISTAIWGTGFALISLLLMALWGFRAINQLLQPVVDLTNAVVAIGGDQYHPNLLAKILSQGSPVGRFARDLDKFAKTIEQRDAALKQEVASLRQQFYEARRRRLKIATPSQRRNQD